MVDFTNIAREPHAPWEHWVAAGLQKLAGLDGDRAADRNGVGFSKLDTDIGCSLAKQVGERGRLTTKQWGLGLKLARRYHRQLPPAPEGTPAKAEETAAAPMTGSQSAPGCPRSAAPPPEAQGAAKDAATVGPERQADQKTTPAAPPKPQGPPLSEDQQRAHDAIVDWFKAPAKSLLTLGGWAGTGKTTMTGAVTATLRAQKRGARIAFVCFTGKASTVLKSKLVRSGALQGSYCGTIHGLIYKPRVDPQTGKILGWEKAPFLELDLIILDEASMVDETTFNDLAGYGVPILAVGDHGQLPPVSGTMNLMGNPDLRLERIHRQAANSPIVRAATMIRETGTLPLCEWRNEIGSVVKTTDKEMLARVPNLAETLVIAGTNRNRVALNYYIRNKLGFKSPEPTVGEKLICLKNNRREALYNGLTGILQAIEPAKTSEHHYLAKIAMDGMEGAPQTYRINRHQFGSSATLKGIEIQGLHHREYGELFDWGAAMTCHKAQGSQARQVVVFEDCAWMRDADQQRRWAYTAVTRAERDLVVIGR